MMMAVPSYAQPGIRKYVISKGNMQVVLGKNLNEKELDEFIKQYDLGNLALKRLLGSNFDDSVKKRGWTIELNNKELLVISKPFFSADNINDPEKRIKLLGLGNPFDENNPAPFNNQVFGCNIFRSKHALTIKNAVVTFLLRNNTAAKKVLLAGDFTDWSTGALPMTHTDSGWSLPVKLKPGKYLYKFIVDGEWMTDPDNETTENDNDGYTNSVYYFTNKSFRLNNFTDAKQVFLAGSFNNWQVEQLWMNRTATGWELPLYLAAGTYTYRYVVDGQWMEDPGNADHFPNEFDEFNSVISIGSPTLFTWKGHQDAQKVFLAGSFNQWRNFELVMTKTGKGWQIPYVLGPGNYEYKFYVDGHWVDAAGNQINEDSPGAIFVIEPNYTFHLKDHGDAKSVFLAGDFNTWSPNGYVMKKEGDGWVMQVHLSPGKHLYKFVVDGQWIRDPENELWEQNEFDTENSVLWIK